mmetsp:Transcript_92248/g.298678  ORF Transcript_92248/g.298678 Transcript_92248/m.298678 type:complete len:226 (+) Transcript_92248:352-1029(+)
MCHFTWGTLRCRGLARTSSGWPPRSSSCPVPWPRRPPRPTPRALRSCHWRPRSARGALGTWAPAPRRGRLHQAPPALPGLERGLARCSRRSARSCSQGWSGPSRAPGWLTQKRTTPTARTRMPAARGRAATSAPSAAPARAPRAGRRRRPYCASRWPCSSPSVSSLGRRQTSSRRPRRPKKRQARRSRRKPTKRPPFCRRPRTPAWCGPQTSTRRSWPRARSSSG